MLKHQLKLMWNKRRANVLLFLEVLLAFLILFGVYTFATFSYERAQSPLGFAYEDGLRIKINPEEELDSIQFLDLQERIRRELEAIDGVEAASFIGFVFPFSNNTWNNGNNNNGFEMSYKLFFGDRNLPEVAEIEVAEGRWYTEEDYLGKYGAVVVNRAFQEKYYPHAERLTDSTLIIDKTFRIVGIVEDFKYYSTFAEREPIVFMNQKNDELNGPYNRFNNLWVRTAPGRKTEVQEEIYTTLTELTKNTEVTIADLTVARKIANRPTILPLVIFALISGFLLINTALGLFGVLFTQINRRRSEIGLRKALGATPGSITRQFVFEVVLVAAAALLLGTFFAVQVALLELVPFEGHFVYSGIGLAVFTILLIVTLCALLPSLQAARLHPATVLHEE